MIDPAGFEDFRNYIKRRVSYARYRIGSTWYETYLSKIEVLQNSKVRVQLNINSSSSTVTVNRVELYNTERALWAHSDCNIEIEPDQTGLFYWFDFTFREEATT